MSADAERRSRLLSVKLRALVRDHLSCDDDNVGSPAVFGAGAALARDDSLWILFDGRNDARLGAALAWAEARQSTQGSSPDTAVHVLVERGSGVLARRAELMAPNVTVWHVDDRRLLPAIADPYPAGGVPSDGHRALIPVIEQAGAEALVEHGVVMGEVRGLEVCRVVEDELIGEVRLEVGMGAHDREAFAMVHGEIPTVEALRGVVDAVAPHRVDGADPHPFNQFAAERLLRWRALKNPSCIGFHTLAPADPPVVRTNLKDSAPCAAIGDDGTGARSAAVFVHGVDLDIVPFALDSASQHGLASVVIVARTRDIAAPIERMARGARVPVQFRFVGA